MPRVTDEYTASKKAVILQCVNEVYEKKRLYQITMQDVIERTGYSHGAVYRYYANLDEIFLDLINQNQTQFQLEDTIDKLLCSERNQIEIITGCIVAIGTFIQDLLKLSAGKMYFEMMVMYTHDVRKRDRILSRLNFRKSLGYAQQKTAEYLIQNVQQGIIKPTISVESLIAFTCAAIDGISNDAVLSNVGQSEENPGCAVDIIEMFQVLSKSIAGFLESDRKADGKGVVSICG